MVLLSCFVRHCYKKNNLPFSLQLIFWKGLASKVHQRPASNLNDKGFEAKIDLFWLRNNKQTEKDKCFVK